jgi:TM2 domain-containing membrane protein YozV
MEPSYLAFERIAQEVGEPSSIALERLRESRMSEEMNCPFCESEITSTAKKCRHCGEWVSRDCLTCGTPIKAQWAARGFCADCEGREATSISVPPSPGTPQVPGYHGPRKNRSVSVGLALVLGGIGAHKFYLDKPDVGFLYLLFCWTGVPSILGIFEAVKYIRMDEEEFHRRFFSGELSLSSLFE